MAFNAAICCAGVPERPTPFGLLKVTRVIPGTCFRPNLPIAFLAFFSLRLWTATAEPAGMLASPSPPASLSESDELDASSAVVFLVGSSSGSSSILGFDMMGGLSIQGTMPSGLFQYASQLNDHEAAERRLSPRAKRS